MNQLLISTFAGVAGGFLSKSFEGSLKSIEDLWYSCFGYKTEMARIKKEVEVEAYKQAIITNLKKIPEENIQRPKLSIVGPAMEASKYYIEEPQLRDMFAQLIASACDSSKSEFTHPAFVECIKQMSSNDAVLFSKLGNYGPLVDYILNLKSQPGLSTVMAEGVHLSEAVPFYSQANCLSISNLARLNIIAFDKLLSGDDVLNYSIYEKSNLYNKCQQEVIERPDIYKDFKLKKYYFNITEFGKAFRAACF